MNATALDQVDFDRSLAALRRLVCAAPAGQTETNRVFFDGSWYRRDSTSGDWLPVGRP